jgi:hypothetical protein
LTAFDKSSDADSEKLRGKLVILESMAIIRGISILKESIFFKMQLYSIGEVVDAAEVGFEESE